MVAQNLHRLNLQPAEEAQAQLLSCCGSSNWARRMAEARPFRSPEELKKSADQIWWSLREEDWLEAFLSHPKIGAGKNDPGDKLENKWAAEEQSGVSNSVTETIDALAELNQRYEEKFGFIFIICATGKSSEEMLRSLERRLSNPGEKELHIAAAEQAKITALRLEKLLNQ